MEIKFLKDFRGKETKEAFYLKGATANIEENAANKLIALGFAEKVTSEPVKEKIVKPKK